VGRTKGVLIGKRGFRGKSTPKLKGTATCERTREWWKDKMQKWKDWEKINYYAEKGETRDCTCMLYVPGKRRRDRSGVEKERDCNGGGKGAFSGTTLTLVAVKRRVRTESERWTDHLAVVRRTNSGRER